MGSTSSASASARSARTSCTQAEGSPSSASDRGRKPGEAAAGSQKSTRGDCGQHARSEGRNDGDAQGVSSMFVKRLLRLRGHAETMEALSKFSEQRLRSLIE